MTLLRKLVLSSAAISFLFSLNGWATDSPGCAAQNPLLSGTYTIQFDGLTRSYRVHVPPDYDHSRTHPMVMFFHGWGGDENGMISSAPVKSQSNQRGYILVAPRGIGSGEPDQRLNSWSFSGSTTGIDGNGAKICDDLATNDYSYASCNDKGIAENTCSWTHCQGTETSDAGFAVALVEDVASQLCIDTDQVFASGSSNGGMFTWELGQNELSASTFRAIAPIIGLPHRGYLDGPYPGTQIPALLITGKNDPTVPPGAWEDSGFTTTSDGDRYFYTGATAITRNWAEALGCSTDAAAASFDEGLDDVDCRSYCAVDENWPVVLDCRANMSHQNGFSWSWKLILDFFDAHRSEGPVSEVMAPNSRHSGAWFDPNKAGQGFSSMFSR
jgi:polyhydroxybutyrate depolymerase